MGCVYYAKADGSDSREAIWGCSAQRRRPSRPTAARLYYGPETLNGRLWAWK